MNKTDIRQYTRAVWSTFAEICSRYPPRFIDALFGVTEISGFKMPYTSQHTRDVPNLSAYKYDCDLITGFSFALMFIYVRLRNALLDIMKYMSSTGIIRNF